MPRLLHTIASGFRRGPVLAAMAIAATAGRAAAPSYLLRYWETDDGLPHNVVNSLVQRSDGFLWLGTMGGAVRFDGVAFARLKSPLLDERKSTLVRCLIEENPQTLTIAGNEPRLLRLTAGVLTVHPVSGRMRPDQRVAALFRQADDVFWIAFEDREVWRWDHGAVARFPAGTHLPGAEIHFARDRAGAVFLNRGGGLERFVDGRLTSIGGTGDQHFALGSSRSGAAWFAISNKLYRLESGRPELVAQNLPWPESDHPELVFESREGAVWVALTEGGVWRWTPRACTPEDLSYPRVRDICEDSEGDLWFATAGGGLDRLRPNRFTALAQDSGLVAGVSASVCEDAAGTVWYANRLGGFRFAAGSMAPIPASARWPEKAVPVCADREGNLWIGGRGALYLARASHSDDPAAVDDRNAGVIRVLFNARDGTVWVGREKGPLECWRAGIKAEYGPADGFPGSAFVQAIGDDRDGSIWVGTRQGELYESSGNRFVSRGTGDGLPHVGIRCIHGDADGNVWIGTGGAGLIVARNGRFHRIGTGQGLPDDTLSQMLEDDHGFLWFGTPRLLFSVAKTDLIACAEGRQPIITPEAYGRSDGLAGFTAADGYQPGAAKTSSGQLWFATRKGLVITDAAWHGQPNTAPRVEMDGFAVDGRAVLSPATRLYSSDREYEFRFTSPAYAAPQDVRFRYRLAGLESDWSEPTVQRRVVFPRLSPGRYAFHVIARQGNRPWGAEDASLAFTVLPLWWQTLWARMAEAALMAGAIGLGVRYVSHRRLKAEVERLEMNQLVETERARIARDLHDGLGSGLTEVGLMAEEMCEDIETLAEMKSQSARLVERVHAIACDLEGAVWTASPKHDNLASVCDYLGQFSREYFRNSAVRCRVDVAACVPPLPVRPDVRHHIVMIAKEAMNNVLKHAGATEVMLVLRTRGDDFILTAVDDGHGFDAVAAQPSARWGLRNIRSRVAEINGKLEIESTPRGTTLRITVSLARSDVAP